jgi:hypothetical protein
MACAVGLGWLINHIELALGSVHRLNTDSIAGREYTGMDHPRAFALSAFKDRIDGPSKA